MLFDVVREQYVQRQLLARRALLATRAAWSSLDPTMIRRSWLYSVGPTVQSIVESAQLQAASTAQGNVTAALAAQGIVSAPVAALDAAAFAGVASDGRDLASLLELSNAVALRAIGSGQSPDQGLALGGRWLEMAVGTQVTDAGRVAAGVATVTRTDVAGFYRVLNPPSCARCIVLAGRWYRWNAAFLRHPRCDCGQVAAARGSLDSDPRLITPERYFDSLSVSEQSRIFTPAGARAIRDGADIGKVVNARRGMYAAGGRDLTHASARGVRGGRPTPEQIYRDANGSRDEALRLLQRFGYIR